MSFSGHRAARDGDRRRVGAQASASPSEQAGSASSASSFSFSSSSSSSSLVSARWSASDNGMNGSTSDQFRPPAAVAAVAASAALPAPQSAKPAERRHPEHGREPGHPRGMEAAEVCPGETVDLIVVRIAAVSSRVLDPSAPPCLPERFSHPFPQKGCGGPVGAPPSGWGTTCIMNPNL